jgi:hypothetical protein
MLPPDVTLQPGEVLIRIDGSGLRKRDFSSVAELEEWVATSGQKGRVHMTMYFAHDSSDMPGSRIIAGTSVNDDGRYVAIRATGEAGRSIEAVLEAVKLRDERIKQAQTAAVRSQRASYESD